MATALLQVAPQLLQERPQNLWCKSLGQRNIESTNAMATALLQVATIEAAGEASKPAMQIPRPEEHLNPRMPLPLRASNCSLGCRGLNRRETEVFALTPLTKPARAGLGTLTSPFV